MLRPYLLTEIAHLFHCCLGSATYLRPRSAKQRREPIPRVRLTKSTIDNLPVLEKDTVYWDAGLPGFGVKVTPKGRKVFLVMYRACGRRLTAARKYTIGPYGRVTLPMAKAQAQKIFAARIDGRDPAERRGSRAAAWSSIASRTYERRSFANTSRRSGRVDE